MISIFKKGSPQIAGGIGDGTMQNPYFWYAIAENTAVTDLSKLAISYNYVHIKVNLTAGQTYSLYCNTGGNFDGYMRLYDTAGTQLDENDDYNGTEDCAIEFTPDTTGDYIIGLGSYDDGGAGTFTSCTVEPAPNTVELPEITYRYPTSSGFNAVGRPERFRSASAAGCVISRIPADGLVFYAPLAEEKATAETGQTLTRISYYSEPNEIRFRTVEDGVHCAYFPRGEGYTSPAINVSQFADGFTFSAWLKREEGNVVYSRRNDYNSCQYLLRATQSTIGFWAADNDAATADVQGEFTEKTTMYNAVWRYYNGTIDLFADGVLIASGTGTLGAADSGADRIAMEWAYHNDSFGGYLAAMRMYSRALADDEIKQLAKEFKVN